MIHLIMKLSQERGIPKKGRIDGSKIRRVISRSPNYLKDYEDDDAAFNEAARNKKSIRKLEDFSQEGRPENLEGHVQ